MTSIKSFTLAGATLLATAATAATASAAPTVPSAAPTAPSGFQVQRFAGAPNAMTTGPDDIAMLDGHLFVSWQNGVGARGQAAPTTHDTQGVVVEYGSHGQTMHEWALKGSIDGLGGQPTAGRVIATSNQDGNPSLFTITPTAAAGKQVVHYRYSPYPDANRSGPLFTGGGTDSVSVRGSTIVLAASAPTRGLASTAAFRVGLSPATHTAYLHPTFSDNASATDALTGQPVTLGITDPDSATFVPGSVGGSYAGDYVLDGQSDQQLVFAHGIGTATPTLTRLPLSYGGQPAGVDDLRWAQAGDKVLYVVDATNNQIDTVTGSFPAGAVYAAQDSIGTKSDGTQVDTINPATGAMTPFVTGLGAAKGLLFAP